jgi:Beta-lactamase
MTEIRGSLRGVLKLVMNIGAGLVAIAQAAGPEASVKPEANVAREIEIYNPAGMTDTGFYEPGKEIPHLAICYSKMSPDGKQLEEGRDNTNTREVKGGPAGGGYSTVEDLVKFHMALRSFKLLNEECTKRVITGKVDAGGPIGRYAYGFGDKVFDGKHIVGHNGGFPGHCREFRNVSRVGLHRGPPHEFGSPCDDAGDNGNPAAASDAVILQETVRRDLTRLR